MTQTKIIQSHDYAGTLCTLIHDATGKPVAHGDTLKTFRGDEHAIRGGAAPHKPGSTGKIYTGSSEYFPSVFGCTWRADNVKTDRLTEAAHQMQKQGGSFAAAIADAYFHADQDNARRLLQAFGHLFDRYAPPKNRAPIIVGYAIGEHFATWIAYGEQDDLTPEELEQIEAITDNATNNAPEGYYFAHWAITDEREEFTKCEATGLMGACLTMRAVYFKL